jgi:DEAD/DEAH box helicase domain-containing protein
VQRAVELVERCDCRAGCPACVGPVLAIDENANIVPRALALRVLKALAPA